MQHIAEFFEQGGFFMYVNLICSTITIAIIVERTIFFLGKGSVNAKAFLEQIRKLVAANNVDRAVKLCSAGAGVASATLTVGAEASSVISRRAPTSGGSSARFELGASSTATTRVSAWPLCLRAIATEGTTRASTRRMRMRTTVAFSSAQMM